MAATFDGTRAADSEDLTPTTGEGDPIDGIWEETDGTAGTLEDNFFYQGNYSCSTLVKTTEFGTCFIPTSVTYDVASNGYLFILKGLVSTNGLLASTRAAGQKFEIGSGATAGDGRPANYIQFYVNTLTTYPIKGGWVIHVFDMRELGYWDNHVGGSTSTSAINYFGHVATMTSTSVKAPNVSLDAIDYYTAGTGLTWVDTGGTFQAFVDLDEGTAANRYGIVTTNTGIIFCLAVLTIGSATATTFSDSNQKIVFPWTYVAEGAQGIKIDLQNASTAIDFSVCSFTGKGNSAIKKYFDTALEVNEGTDYITIPNHGLTTGDYITYSREGGSDDIGPEPGNYWAYVATANTFGLSTSRTNAYAGTISALTTASAPGENHSIIRDVDNRPDFTVSSTSGAFDSTSCIYEGFRIITLTSACTIDQGFLLGIGNIIASTATISNVTVADATLEEGAALFTPLTTLDNITYCAFDGANTEGHAIEITSAGSMNSVGNTFDNYWAPDSSGSNLGWNFHTITGIDSNIITTNANHGFSSGDAVFYNKEGGSDAIGLTDGNKYYINAASANTLTVHATRAAATAGSSAISLSDGGSGETHSLYSSKAAVFNDSSGTVTINVSGNGDSPSYRNGTGSTTVIQSAVTLTVNVEDENGDPVQDAQVIIFKTGDTPYTSDSNNNANDIYFTINETISNDVQQAGSLNIWNKSTNKSLTYRYRSWVNKTFTLVSGVDGTANTGGTSEILTWKTGGTGFYDLDIEEGDAIRNTTDGSWAVIDEIVSNSGILTTTLIDPPGGGGSDYTWEEDDAFSINKIAINHADNDDLVYVPIMQAQTDITGVATRSYTGSTGAITVRIRTSSGATKYKPYDTSGTIDANGYTLTAVLQLDETAE